MAALSFAATAASAKNPLAVTVTPTPFYSDIVKMKVTFTTPTVAPTGRRYFAHWQTLSAGSTLPAGCSPSSDIDVVGVRGGKGKRVAIILRPEPLFGDAFCPGPSKVAIVTQFADAKGQVRNGATAATAKQVVVSRFRVYRPQ